MTSELSKNRSSTSKPWATKKASASAVESFDRYSFNMDNTRTASIECLLKRDPSTADSRTARVAIKRGITFIRGPVVAVWQGRDDRLWRIKQARTVVADDHTTRGHPVRTKNDVAVSLCVATPERHPGRVETASGRGGQRGVAGVTAKAIKEEEKTEAINSRKSDRRRGGHRLDRHGYGGRTNEAA